MIFFRDTISQTPRSSPQGFNSDIPDRSPSFDMSLFDLAAKFGGLSTHESDDHEGYTGPRDYGYTQTAAYESGYDGAPPTGYPSGPQRGQAEYKRSHEGYSTSDPARAYVQESAYAAPPAADEYHPQQSDFGGRGDRPGSPALPDGWIKRFDERHGRWYYVDETTGTSQWEPPKTSFDDGGYGGSQHASKDQVYDAHSGAGEAAGYYTGHHYGQNAPLYGQAPVQDYRSGQHGGASYAQGAKAVDTAVLSWVSPAAWLLEQWAELSLPTLWKVLIPNPKLQRPLGNMLTGHMTRQDTTVMNMGRLLHMKTIEISFHMKSRSSHLALTAKSLMKILGRLSLSLETMK
ncbi:hypothetical protein HYQ44_007416 [Verticillium longisporum]|nr:hypothetical protein HYQ44_007416 [Verticillium longisporum]